MSLPKKAGSTVVEYFEWDLPKVLSQGIAELLKYTDNRRFSSEPDVVESSKDADSYKGSNQNLVQLSTTRIVSHYMTLFLALNHERFGYRNGL